MSYITDITSCSLDSSLHASRAKTAEDMAIEYSFSPSRMLILSILRNLR